MSVAEVEKKLSSHSSIAIHPVDVESGHAVKSLKSSFGGSDHSQAVVAPLMSKNDNWKAFLIFVILGNGSLFLWNAYLNAMIVIQMQLFPDYPDMGTTITALYNTGSVLFCIILSFYGATRGWLMYLGSVLLIITSLLVAVVCQCAEGKTGYALIVVVLFFGGVGTSLLETGAFAYSGIMPKIYAGAASFGLGLSGILSFVIWMVLRACLLDVETPEAARHMCWAFFSISAFFAAISMPTFWWLMRYDWARKSVDNSRANALAAQGHADLEPSNWWKVLVMGKTRIFDVFFTMFLSLQLFPNVGPVNWNYEKGSQFDTVMGMFQVGDFLGRYIPNMVSFIPFINVSPRNLTYFSLGRLIFIPLFTCMMVFSDKPVLGDFWFGILIMLLMSLSSGYVMSLAMMYMPATVQRPVDIGRVMNIGVIFILAGIVIGCWVAKLYLLYEP